MRSQLEPAFAEVPSSGPMPSPDPRVEDFLDHLTAPLVGMVPYEDRQALRLEIRDHLGWLADEAVAAGEDPEKAIAAALQEFGDPWQTGEAILRERQNAHTARSESRWLHSPAMHGLAWFGPPAIASLLLLEQLVFAPREQALVIPLAVTTLLAPFGAGCLTAVTCPAKADQAAVWGAGVMSAASLVVGATLLPRVEVLLLGLFQLLFWLPCGWLSAVSVVTTRRQRRRHHFLRLVSWK